MPPPHKNEFLDALSESSRDVLLPHCVEVDLPLKKSLYQAETLPTYAYFMTSGIASVVTEMENGDTAEVGLIGKEGIVGSLHLLGSSKVSTNCFIQLEATALKLPITKLARAFRIDEEIRDRVLDFVQVQAVGLGKLAGCHRLHNSEERLSRWLLMAQDRTQSDILTFTQEFLGMMLGSRRITVTLIAGALQRSGLIEYRRGYVRIINREELEAAACECYKIMKDLHTSLYSQALPQG